jgi:Rieske Fe-S protein
MEPAPTRRTALARITVALSGAIGALLSVPLLGGLLSPVLRRPAATTPRAFVPLIQLWDLTPGVPRRVEVLAEHIDAWAREPKRVMGAAWLIRTGPREVKAFSTVCPHLGCAVDATPRGFGCPCHTSVFSDQGEVVSGPSPRSMDPLEVKVEDSTVYVRYARFKQGQKQREEI